MAKKVDAEYYRQLEQIQAADFVLVELSLYLNTHPHDEDALKQFNQYSGYSRHLKRQFESSYGPLLQFGNSPRARIGIGEKGHGRGKYKEECLNVGV